MSGVVENHLPAHVLSVGTFAHAVAQRLKIRRSDVIESTIGRDSVPASPDWVPSRMILLIAWRAVPSLCEFVNHLSFERDRPFVPVIQDLTVLRVGPIIMPGLGPCWNCWATRLQQHAGWTAQREALLDHYESHPDEGPRGFVEPLVRIASSILADRMDAIDTSSVTPGLIWQLDILTGEITTATLVGVHNCTYCGLRRSPLERSVSGIREQLSYLWSSGGDVVYGRERC
jgi:bacteriocin biosynthesis cyclodehydratase domain-containing protein